MVKPKLTKEKKPSATKRERVKSIKAKEVGAITRKGILAIDTDGIGDHHGDKTASDETSAMWDKNGKFVFKFTKGGKKNPAGISFLNADTDEYAVAPESLADVRGGPLKVGDRATVVLPNKVSHSAPIGDFGPPKKVGEFSLKAIRAMGVSVLKTKGGPIPTLDGKAASDIHVTVTFFPGTAV